MSNVLTLQTARRPVWRPLLELPARRELILSLVRRELAARYRGSTLGVVWTLLTPLVMIAIYTLLFANFFGARFNPQGSTWDYALYLFCGLLPWTAFQEAASGAATNIVRHTNLVKRVVFPLEVLPVAGVLASAANQLYGTLALVAATLVVRRELHVTLLWLPLLVALQTVFVLGVAWLVASLGVFLRDTREVVQLVLVAWLYLTPIIYPEGIVPEQYRAIIDYNPWSGLIRSYRRVMLEGAAPDPGGLLYFALFASASFLFGYWWFAKTRRNFADVI